MIDQQLRPFGPSLVEAVLARWLLSMSGREYQFDEFEPHGRRDRMAAMASDSAAASAAPAADAPCLDLDTADAPRADTPASSSAPSSATGTASTDATSSGSADGADPSAEGLEVDDRFPGLGRFGRLLEVGAGHLAVAHAAYIEQGRQAAVQARALAAFAAARPAALLDRPDQEVGSAAAASRAGRPAALTEVSEWAVDEVMATFALSSRAAGGLLADSLTLVQRLPATLDAVEAGVISWAHARMLAEVLGPVKDAVRAAVEARLLARAAGKTVAQLRPAAHRAVLAADPAAAADRLARAVRTRGVRLHPGKDGMASLDATLTLPVAAACRKALAAYADQCATPGDARTLDQRMADSFADLILRPGLNRPVQIALTLVAGVNTMTGGDEPAELDGHPIPAELARQLAHVLGLLLPQPETTDAPAEPAGPAGPAEPADQASTTEADQDQASPTEGSPTEGSQTEGSQTEASQDTAGQDHAGQDTADQDTADPGAEPEPPSAAAFAAFGPAPGRRRETADRLGELMRLRSTTGTALAHLPRIAIVEELTGQLLALTDATGLRAAATCHRPRCRTGKRACPHPPTGPTLGPPPPSPGYRPPDPLDRFVRARDRRCRFPGCRATAIRCDLDHNTPWPTGPTSADNLCCLCRHHHRLSHQAPGWTMRRLPDGGLQWTTPGGKTITTHPQPYGTDDLPPQRSRPDSPSVEEPPTKRPLTMLEQLRRWPPPAPDPDEEPPPF